MFCMVGEEKAKSRERYGRKTPSGPVTFGLKNNLKETGGGKLTVYPGERKKKGTA